VRRKSVRKRLRAKLALVRQTLLRQRHRLVSEQGAWLRQVIQGWLNYHAIPGNMPSLETFYAEIRRIWLYALRRRSQRQRMPWSRFQTIADRWLPRPKITQAYPNVRFDARHPK
jgi:RNA-directed DNA polymerase